MERWVRGLAKGCHARPPRGFPGRTFFLVDLLLSRNLLAPFRASGEPSLRACRLFVVVLVPIRVRPQAPFLELFDSGIYCGVLGCLFWSRGMGFLVPAGGCTGVLVLQNHGARYRFDVRTVTFPSTGKVTQYDRL